MQKKSFLLNLTLFLLFIFSLSKNSWGYEFTEDFIKGSYWKTFPIIMEEVSDKRPEDRELKLLLEKAQNEWETALGLDLWEMQPAISSQRLLKRSPRSFIRWSYHFYEETGFDADETLGITIRHSVNGITISSGIILNGENKKMLKNKHNILYKTILHELGHTIHIDHSLKSSVMAEKIAFVIHELQKDDIEAGIHMIKETLKRRNHDLYNQKFDNSYLGPTCGRVLFDNGDDDQRGGPSGGLPLFMLFFLILSFLLPKIMLKIFPLLDQLRLKS